MLRTLFATILVVVSVITRLVAPNLFSSTDDTIAALTETPSADVPTEMPTQDSLADLNAVINPVVEATPTPDYMQVVNPAQTGASADQIFGQAKTDDNFDRGSSGFGLSAGLNDDENIRIVALNNRLSLEPKKNNGWVSWRLRPPVINEGAAEMEFSIITCARGDRTGIMMRAKDYNSGNGYYFSLSCEGTLSILRDSVVLNTADARSAFKNNSGDVNVLSAIVLGNTLTAALNGQSLLTVQDDTYKEGFSGFFTAPQGDKTLTMDILSFKEYYREQ
ncbi:MAG: hypothetical protein IJI14_10760 [Anaerolineaceae bacterium]|nr:hypothetical protein [Anaerolineaceae bacterium]